MWVREKRERDAERRREVYGLGDLGWMGRE